MKKGIIIGAVILVLIIAVAVFLMISIHKDPTSSNNSPLQSNPVVNTQVNSIDISNFAFSPATLTIKVGDSVTWTNKDTMAHTVTSDSGNELASSNLAKGQTYTHTFNTKGSFDYHCSLHTSMKAEIIVQ